MTTIEIPSLPDPGPGDASRPPETIEERCFSAALICLEGHYTNSPPMGPMTASRVSSMVSKTLEKTHTFKHVRLVLLKFCCLFLHRGTDPIVGRFFPEMSPYGYGLLGYLGLPSRTSPPAPLVHCQASMIPRRESAHRRARLSSREITEI